MNIIELNKIYKTYGKGNAKIEALKNINLQIKKGEFVAIMGPSGSGKTTLLNILGLLDKPKNGIYVLDNQKINSSTNINTLAKLRKNKIGFVFQNYNLLPRTSALDNVILPAIYSGLKNRKEIALELLEQVGLKNRIKHKPNELSGGEKQRVAIARSLINKPKIILADEPTGNLDTKSGQEIMRLFTKLNQEKEMTIVMITHESEIANYAMRTIRMKDGEII